MDVTAFSHAEMDTGGDEILNLILLLVLFTAS